MTPALRPGLAAVLLAVALGGCTTSSQRAEAGLVSVSWRSITLPAPSGSRIDLRALGSCGHAWFAAGATVDSAGNHPALWFSPDGSAFTALKITPRSVYGPQNVLYSVACDGRRVAAVGAAVGGVHGNPRTSTWQGPVGAGATITEQPAAFETYGGPDAVGVGEITAGPRGFVIVGGRVDANHKVGAAVWQSTDGTGFRLIDNDPALESGPDGETEVHGAYGGPSGFTAVGGIAPAGSAGAERNAAAWTSPDGRTWQRIAVPARPGDDILERVVATPTGLLAAGADGSGFAAWTASADGTGWTRDAHFADHAPVTSVPRIIDLVSAPDRKVYAALSTGDDVQLWRGPGALWSQMRLPSGVTSIAGLAGDGTTTLLATPDGAIYATG